MALKEYCQVCGGSTTYTLTKPKFCSECGELFTGAKPVPKKTIAQRPAPHPTPRVIEAEEVEDDGVVIPDISNLEVRIEHREAPKVTLGQVGIQAPLPASEKFRRPTVKMSQKKFLEQFRREAGGIKTESIQVGGGSE